MQWGERRENGPARRFSPRSSSVYRVRPRTPEPRTATPISYSPPDAEPDGSVRSRGAALVEARSDEGGVDARCVGRGAAGRGAPAERRLDGLQLVPVHARRRLRRSAARRRGLVDAARAASRSTGGGMPMATSRSAGRSRGRLARSGTSCRKGTTVARPELGHSVHVEVERARARPRVLVSLPRRARSQPDRAHANRARRRRRRRSAALRDLRLQPLRDRLLHRVPAHRRRSSSTSSSTPATTSTKARADGGRNAARVRQHSGDEIYTLVDYRNRYAHVQDGSRSAAPRTRSAPFIVTWDDHEVDNNYAGDVDENGTPPEMFLLRRAAAYQAYYEHMPLRAAALPTRRAHALYRRLQFGRLHRSERARHAAVALESGVRRRRRRGCAAALDPSRTMLGRRAGAVAVRASSARRRRRWTVLGQQVPTVRARQPARRSRRALLDGQMGRLRRGRAAAALRAAQGDEGAESDRPLRRRARALRRRPEARFREPANRETVGVEFTNTSVTSGGDGADVSRQLGAHARRQPAHQISQRPPRLHRLHGDARRRCAPTSRSSTA